MKSLNQARYLKALKSISQLVFKNRCFKYIYGIPLTWPIVEDGYTMYKAIDLLTNLLPNMCKRDNEFPICALTCSTSRSSCNPSHQPCKFGLKIEKVKFLDFSRSSCMAKSALQSVSNILDILLRDLGIHLGTT